MYEEPQFDEEGNFKKEIMTEEQKQIKLELPLKEGVLTTNCGIPIAFVVNKSDIVNQTGEKNFYEENSEFILKHIRQIAISYGASIIYVSGRANTNLDVLYDYICHRLFGFILTHKPNLTEKDSFFIPAGYDSLTALRDSDTQNMLSILYDEKIPPTKVKSYVNEEEIVCEDTNVFLGRLKTEKPRDRSHLPSGNLSSISRTHQPRTSDIAERGSVPLEGAGKFNRFMKNKSEEKKEDVKKNYESSSGVTPTPSEPKSTKPEDKENPEEKKKKLYNKTKLEMIKKLELLKKKK